MFFRTLKALRATRQRFDELTAGGMDPSEAGDLIVQEATAAKFDIETIMAIISLIKMLIEMFQPK